MNLGRYIIYIILIILLVGLEIGVFSSLTIFGGVINLMVLILVSAFFLGIEREGLIFSLIIAAAYDLYSYNYFGISIIALLLIYGLLVLMKQKVYEKTNIIMVLITTFFATIVFELMFALGVYIPSHFNLIQYLLYSILPSALINLIVAAPFFIVFEKFISILKLYHIIEVKEDRIMVGY